MNEPYTINCVYISSTRKKYQSNWFKLKKNKFRYINLYLGTYIMTVSLNNWKWIK